MLNPVLLLGVDFLQILILFTQLLKFLVASPSSTTRRISLHGMHDLS